MQLFEQYRPRAWSEVVGQDSILAKLDSIRAQSGTLAGHGYFITGGSGQGKSTIGYLIAGEVAETWSTQIFDDPSELTSETLKSLSRQRDYRPMGRGYCNIVNEIHGLRADQIRKLLGMTERMPDWITWVFTTRVEAAETLFDGCDDTPAFLSRCVDLQLARRDLATPFAQRVQWILQDAGIGQFSIDTLVKLAKQCRNNMRQMLSVAETWTAQEAA